MPSSLPVESEELFHCLFEQASLGIAVEDLAGKVLIANPALCSILGYTKNEVCGMHCSQFAGEEDSADDHALFQQLSTGAIDHYSLEKRYLRKDGTRLWGRLHVSLVKHRDAESPLVFAFVENINEWKQTEEALRESEQRLRLAVQAGKMYAFDWDAETDGIVRSAECAHTLNWIDDPMRDTGQEFYSRVHPHDRDAYAAMEAALTSENPAYQTSYRMLRSDGSVIWLEDTGRASFDAQGKILRVIGMVSDITERKRNEEEVRQKDAELSEAQRLAGVGSWQWNAQTDTVTWSKELCRLIGHDPTLPPPSFSEQPSMFSPETWGHLQRAVQEAFQTGKSYELDMEIVSPKSTARWAIARGEPLRSASGEIIGLRGTVQDITERKRAETALAGVSRRLIEAQEQERTRIGRELHDDVGQRLSLLAVELQQLLEDPPDLYEIRERITTLHQQATEIATDVQSLSHQLHSSKLQYLGLAAAVRAFCGEFGKQQKVEIDFQADDLPSLSPDTSLCLFRVLQEALHNSAKHSGIRHFQVQLSASMDEIQLMVRDAGAGFDREAARHSHGLGLTSMEERLKLLNGTLSIDSHPRSGTTVQARVPLPPGNQLTRAAG